MVHACSSSIQKAKAEGSEVQDHPRLNSKFEAALPTLESVQDRETETGEEEEEAKENKRKNMAPVKKRSHCVRPLGTEG